MLKTGNAGKNTCSLMLLLLSMAHQKHVTAYNYRKASKYGKQQTSFMHY